MIDAEGKDVSGEPPILVFNHPGDIDLDAKDPVTSVKGSLKPMIEAPIPAEKLLETFADRGLIFLTSTLEDRTVNLQLAHGSRDLAYIPHISWGRFSEFLMAPRPALGHVLRATRRVGFGGSSAPS